MELAVIEVRVGWTFNDYGLTIVILFALLLATRLEVESVKLTVMESMVPTGILV
jgi:hypothetical protein